MVTIVECDSEELKKFVELMEKHKGLLKALKEYDRK